MGNLGDVVSGRYKGSPIGDEYCVLRQITCGLDYLHKKGFFHGGLTPDNILVSQSDDSIAPLIKLANFGVLRRTNDQNLIPLSKRVDNNSKSWLPPEIFNRFTRQMDMFTLGCICGFCFLEDAIRLVKMKIFEFQT